jgi:hypothetical protein
MIDVVENDRRCRDDGGIVRECHVAYGHYKDYPAFWPSGPKKPPLVTFRIALLCERGERGRKDCIALEQGKTYPYTPVDVTDQYPYLWYEDFTSPIYIVTPQGKAMYAGQGLASVRQAGWR